MKYSCTLYNHTHTAQFIVDATESMQQALFVIMRRPEYTDFLKTHRSAFLNVVSERGEHYETKVEED